MANKRIRTSPRYLEFSSVVGGNLYTVTGDGIVVDETIATTLAATATAANIGTVISDTSSPVTASVSPLTRFSTPVADAPYAIPLNAMFLTVRCQGPGGGGGAGRQGAVGTGRGAGGGGGGGGYSELTFAVADLAGATQLLVTVLAGGAGGTAATTPDTNGNFGGGTPLLTQGVKLPSGQMLVGASSGGGGFGGTSASTSNGNQGSGGSYGSSGAGGASVIDGAIPGNTASIGHVAPGGSAGGGLSTTNTAFRGGGLILPVPVSGLSQSNQAATATPTSLDTDGANGNTIGRIPQGGAGGGAGTTTKAGKGGNGYLGGGGGGGGGSTNGMIAGAGGNGGDGYVEILAYTNPF